MSLRLELKTHDEGWRYWDVPAGGDKLLAAIFDHKYSSWLLKDWRTTNLNKLYREWHEYAKDNPTKIHLKYCPFCEHLLDPKHMQRIADEAGIDIEIVEEVMA